ncbi:hypothetical protein L6164_032318 [Bauhinia variegata]|uniref:Uncharacterized protein n=1 Tax=Bauhinia variegata TaxID=167791 RepID=A0ACB9KNF0_BAUVA|nr:hypothetical protein L6164_032318 [Bauhinia variegata]
MDVQSSFIFVAFCFLLVWSAKNLIQETKSNRLDHKLPPRPWKLPLMGNLHQLAAAGSLPHRALRKLAHKYGPLMHLQLGEISAVIVSSPDMAKEIMKTSDLAFAQRPQILYALIMLY